MSKHKKSLGVFIKTCKKDHEWLIECLKSINTNLIGFQGLCIVTDEDHNNIEIAKKLITTMPIHIYRLPVPELNHTCQDGIGYIWMQNIKLTWHKFCDFNAVLQIDSDCIVENTIHPEFYRINNKWKWLVRPWKYAELAIVHQAPLEKLMKTEALYEHMPFPGWIMERKTTEKFHTWLEATHDCVWWDYLLDKTRADWGNNVPLGKSRGSSIYNAYGGFLELSQSTEYEFIDVIKTNWQDLPPIKQYWSWVKTHTGTQHGVNISTTTS